MSYKIGSGKYQGWRNWTTWNIVLWFGNDRGLYESVREYRGKFNAAKAKDFVLDLLPQGTPDMKDLSPGEVHTAYAKASWSEIARSFNDDKS